MACDYRYVGCFVDKQELDRRISFLRLHPLAKEVLNPHVTFVYKPDKVDERLIGKPVRIRVIGYGNDGTNEGLKVEVFAEDATLCDMIEAIPVAHITLAVSESGEAVNTRFLVFTPVEPLEIEGVFDGAW